MDPCDRYQSWVRTASGLTPGDPVGFVGSIWDWWEWGAVAERILGALRRLVEQRAAMGDSAWPAKLAEYTSRFDSATGALSYLSPSSWTEEVDRMVTLSQEAACDVGVLEDEIQAAGKRPDVSLPNRPRETSSPKTKGGGMFIVLALVAAIVWGVRE